ncbi:MAG: hypothetical protein KAU29_07355 [Gammaproteobacteria bacterium]|nr:hypothetical protein [Gammaproteobacteria bacterium]
MNSDDYLFLEIFAELRWRLNTPSSYNVVKSAGLARMLFVDGHPLVDVVNKNRRLKYGFHCTKGSPIKIPGIESSLSYYPIQHDSNATPKSRDEFLGVEVISSGECAVSIKDIIKFLSIKWGGIHFEPPKKPKDMLLVQIDGVLKRGGGNLVVRLMWNIGAIILKDMQHMQREIWGSYRSALAPEQDRLFGHYQADESMGFAYTFGDGYLQNVLSKSLEQGFAFCSVLKLIPDERCSGVIYEVENKSTKQKVLRVQQQSKSLIVTVNDEHSSESITINDIELRGMTSSFFVLTVELYRYERNMFWLSVSMDAVEIRRIQCQIDMPVILGRQSIGATVDGDERGRFFYKEAIVREQFNSQQARDEAERFLWVNCIV